jgi:hypothetical protein
MRLAMECYAIVRKSGGLQDGTESDFLIYKKRGDALRVCDKRIGEKVKPIKIMIVAKKSFGMEAR